MWENTTSYSKSDDRTEIRTTGLAVDVLDITVTKYIGYGDELVMHCRCLGIETRPLNTSDMEEGQKRALAVVTSRAKKILYAVDQI